MKLLKFLDLEIHYDAFVKDLSARIVNQLKNDRNDPEFISQRTAFKIFGRSNVERWRRQGKVTPHMRPGKVEYKTADLRFLQRTVFDQVNSIQTDDESGQTEDGDTQQNNV